MGVRTIYVTGGYGPDVVVVDVAGISLTGVTFKLALAPETTAPYRAPLAADARWVAVSKEADGSLKLTIDSTQGAGDWFAWLQLNVGGSIRPFLVLDTDGKPLHVKTL